MKPFDTVGEEYQKLHEGNGRKLTNMGEFNAVAAEFRETGQYTKLSQSPSKTSQYYKFWQRETDRCVNGYHTGYDYIPGYYYHYLNYSPILLSRESDEEESNSETEVGKLVKAERKIDFPSIWDGDYYQFHYLDEAELAGKHAVTLKTRGRGYSFKGGSMLTRNYYHFPGSNSFAFATKKDYLIRDGILTKAWNVMDFIDANTPWSKKRHVKNQDMHRRASFIRTVNGVPVEDGYKSNIMGITFNNDPDAGRGVRGKLVLWEEFGNFPDGLQAWRVAMNSMKQGRSVFGLMLGFGTGGSDESSFEAIEELVYNPEGYQVHTIINAFDDARYGTPCGFFHPVTMNQEGFYDDNGNSDIMGAKDFILKDRERVRKNTSDPMAVARMKAEEPITIQEALLSVTSNIFPVNDCMMRRGTLEAHVEIYQNTDYIGELLFDDEHKLRWRNMADLVPIRKFPLQGKDHKEGAITIFEPPVKINGEIPHGVYIAGTDPYDHDEALTDSLGSTFIMNLLTDRVVAEYTGRPARAEIYYENVRRMLMYYNARSMYENNVRGMHTYFRNKNSLHLLATQPEILKDISPGSTVQRGYGAPGTIQVNKFCRGLSASYLLEDNVINENIMNVYKLRSIPLLREFELWNAKKNFDRVSAFGMMMLYRAELNKNASDLDQRLSRPKEKKYLSKGSFLRRNYTSKHQFKIDSTNKND